MKSFSKFVIAAALCTAAGSASAATIDVSVSGKAGPWDQSVNPTLSYDSAATAPTVVTSSTGLLAGTAYTISYVSGTTQTVYFYSETDGRGYSNLNGGIGFPSYYTADKGASSYLQELMGAFADSTGKVVGTPFMIGNGGSFLAPAGAAEILLGINDNHYADNLGSLTVSVSGAGVSAVPLPASAPLFGAAVLALGAFGYGAKRRKAATAA